VWTMCIVSTRHLIQHNKCIRLSLPRARRCRSLDNADSLARSNQVTLILRSKCDLLCTVLQIAADLVLILAKRMRRPDGLQIAIQAPDLLIPQEVLLIVVPEDLALEFIGSYI